MDIKKLEKELENAEVELEEMAMQLADMLGAALYFAGVKKEDLQKVVDLYLQGLDEVFEGEDEDEEMGFEEVIQVIKHLQKKYPKFFDR